MANFSAELELGEAIEEIIRTEVAVNMAIENYFSQTNRGFFEKIFKHYGIIEEWLGAITSDAEGSGNETSLFIQLRKYHARLLSSKQAAIKLFLEKCKEIVDAEGLVFDPEHWFSQQTGSNDAVSNDVIINAIMGTMKEIRSIEETKERGNKSD